MTQYELVRMRTKDGIELQGLLAEPKRPRGMALLHVHGWIGNFYENAFIETIAAQAVELGVAFLSFNNRGCGIVTDFITSRSSHDGYRRLGGCVERIEDSLLDIDAAVKFLKARGFSGGVLQGHSLGCQKAVLYASKRRSRWLKGLVLLAPVDDAACAKGLLGERYGSAIRCAQNLVRKGKGDFLGVLPPHMEFYPLLTPQRFLEVSSPATLGGRLLDYSGNLKEVRSIRVPVLPVFGSKDHYQRAPKFALNAMSGAVSHCDPVLLPGTGHLFAGKEAELAEIIAKWMKGKIL